MPDMPYKTEGPFATVAPPQQVKAPWQFEVEAMAAVATALEPLDNEARARVLRWLAERFVTEQAPASLAVPHTDANVYANSGHGHVRPRPDGHVARCGGSAICRECSQEAVGLVSREPRKVEP